MREFQKNRETKPFTRENQKQKAKKKKRITIKIKSLENRKSSILYFQINRLLLLLIEKLSEKQKKNTLLLLFTEKKTNKLKSNLIVNFCF